MHLILYRTGILSVVAAIFFIGSMGHGNQSANATDELYDREELSLPITDRKLVIAHCMTNIIRYKGHKLEDSCNPEFYSPGGNISAPIGGLTQVKVLSDPYLANATLEEAVEFEMKAALQSGIDGFQFYYTLGNDSWDEIIKAYLKVATEKNIDFKFTFCISHPSGGDEESRIADFAKRMNSIFDAAGHNNPHWLRTPDGRLILYTWYGDNLADIPTGGGRPAAYYVANAYKKLGDAVKEKFACIISINEQISKEKLNQYLDYFPAVWLWTLPYTDTFIGNMVAAECRKRKRTFTGSAFPGFYTSKLLKKGTWDMFHFAEDAVRAGIKNAERKYIVTGLSYNFRKQWEFGIDKDVSLMNIITWNDYPEGHHLAPEANHNDGFSLLLRYYKSVWKKEPSPFEGKDVLIAFYKKYNHKLSPSPYDIPVIEIEKPGIAVAVEDSIEVVSIAKDKATILVNDNKFPVTRGLQTIRFAAVPGAVSVALNREGQNVERFTCPEWITDKPYRTDRMTCSFSNYSDAMIRNLFGNSYTLVPGEYNAEAPGNNIHFYKGK